MINITPFYIPQVPNASFLPPCMAIGALDNHTTHTQIYSNERKYTIVEEMTVLVKQFMERTTLDKHDIQRRTSVSDTNYDNRVNTWHCDGSYDHAAAAVVMTIGMQARTQVYARSLEVDYWYEYLKPEHEYLIKPEHIVTCAPGIFYFINYKTWHRRYPIKMGHRQFYRTHIVNKAFYG